MANNYEYMKFLDLTGAQQIWNTCKQTFVQTVNGVGIDANGNVNTSGVNFPVGYIYLTTDNSTSPASLFGGTWTQIKDVFLLGAGDTYSNGATGGEATHTHIISSSKTKAHLRITGTTIYADNMAIDWWEPSTKLTASSYTSDHTYQNYGVGVHGETNDGTNLPPYLVVYMWKRTA